MDLGIAGKTAIVCGSSRGLGRACAHSLARAGRKVVVNGIDEGRLATAARENQKETGSEIVKVVGDVTTHAVQNALFEK